MADNNETYTIHLPGPAMAVLLGLSLLGGGGATYFGVNRAQSSLEREVYELKTRYETEMDAAKERISRLENDLRALRAIGTSGTNADKSGPLNF